MCVYVCVCVCVLVDSVSEALLATIRLIQLIPEEYDRVEKVRLLYTDRLWMMTSVRTLTQYEGMGGAF